MKNIVQFIDAEYLKANTPIEQNVDDTLLNQHIRKVQRLHVESILGTTFYDSLSNKIVAGTLNADEDNLIRDYIQPMLAEYTIYYVLPFIARKLTNKSVSEKGSEFSTASDLEDLKYIRNGVLDEAEFFAKRLINELTQNYSKYPEYYNADCENLPSTNRAYFSGLYMKKGNGCDKRDTRR